MQITESIIKYFYKSIKENKLPTSQIFTMAKIYVHRHLTEEEKTIVTFYVNKIQTGELSLEECLQIYRQVMGK